MENCFFLLCFSRSEDLYRNSDMILPAKLRQASQKRHFPRVYAFYLGPIQETEGSVFPANFKGLDAIALWALWRKLFNLDLLCGCTTLSYTP